MVGYSIGRKCLAVGIILLFVGVAIAPNIQVTIVRASIEDEFVEVTTEAFGIAGLQPKTVKLTKQQSQEVKMLFDELKNRLSDARTIEETTRIFNETVVSLYQYDLLPRGMSIEQAKQLVTERCYNQKALTLLQKIFMKSGAGLNTGGINNSFCLVAGASNNTHILKPIIRLANDCRDLIEGLIGNILMDIFFNYPGDLFTLIVILLAVIPVGILLNIFGGITKFLLFISIVHTGVEIYYGSFPSPQWYRRPANGWISTVGTKGKQDISGSFWGQNVVGGWDTWWDSDMNYSWRGIIGFKGLMFRTGLDNVDYFGSARHVNVGPDCPDIPWPNKNQE